MKLHEFTISVPRYFKISLCPLGDFHIGTKACAIDKLKALIKWVKDTPDVYVIGLGDYCDLINLSDSRFDPTMIADSISDQKNYLCRMAQNQAEECIELFTPIKDRIIGLGEGNHEFAIQKHYHYDIMYRICGALDVRYLGWSSLTRLRMKRKSNYKNSSYIVNIFCEHGSQAGRKKGGKVNSLEDRSNDIEADIYLRGHSHDKLATTKVQLYMPKQGVPALAVKKRVYAICPSFFQTYTKDAITYGEMKGYPPTSTGIVRIDIKLRKSQGKDKLDYHIYQ